MNSQQGLELEFIDDNNLAGFRLQRLEILNWGTFHNKVWKVELNGKNGLLTGDIGSGKSTVVDAITTLLVPAQRIAYNKAAGAESKERDLRSYVLGYYKSERDSETGIIKPAQLRGNNSYSVILGVFYNEGYDQYISLAQVFWLKEQQAQPARFFVGAEQALTITEHFANFGSEITALRKQLRKFDLETFDTFPPYAAWFRRRFGIQNDQALELFHQTVSMKSVGNLTDFVRSHMLEPFEETKQRINHLLVHFDDLNRAYQAVLKAEDQVALLTPIIEQCEQYQQTAQQIEDLNHYIENLSPYFSELEVNLLETLLTELAQKWQLILENIAKLEQLKGEQAEQIDQIKWDIQQNGGNRLTELARQIKEREKIKAEREHKFTQYKHYIQQLDELVVNNSADFIAQKQKLHTKQQAIQHQSIEYSNLEVEENINLRQLTSEIESINKEITGLKQRESNIGETQIQIRSELCQALKLNEEKFPFVGELLQVRETEKDWEGATERLLHNFALSLIVPDEYYPQVSDWVNNNHLKGRIVYYRVAKNQPMLNNEIHPNSLLYKLEIKPNNPYYQWLENELYKRFDFVACDSAEQFRRESRAITQKGQIKDKSGRHEKDDRYRIDDRRRYVLGWSNKDKIATLVKTAKQLDTQLKQVQEKIIHYKTAQQKLKTDNELLIRLEAFHSFSEIDFEEVVKEIALLNQEYQQLRATSDVLKQLNQQLAELEQAFKQTEKEYIQLVEQKGRLEQTRLDAENRLKLTALFVEDSPVDEQTKVVLADYLANHLVKRSLTLDNCDTVKTKLREQFEQQIKEAQQGKIALFSKI
ncbi:hypothetical protein BMT54_09330 [Pasteurellaceae bacterium 15-036681]|nr:hypothetical protein BMT54_09330 [Pasteurellaceae bacterium 15-036681]